MWEYMIEHVREKVPLIHCITNYVTVNDVANMLLAAGGSPIMADGLHEVEEITSLCNGLVINIGTLNPRTVKSMIKAGRRANKLEKVVVLDPVGVGASEFRTKTALKIIDQVDCSVIRGNISEMKALAVGLEKPLVFWKRKKKAEETDQGGTTRGVDADSKDRVTEANLNDTVAFAKNLCALTEAIIVITGAIDIVASPQQTFIIRNGHPIMSRVSGTGCMLDGVIAAYCVANPDAQLHAVAAAVSAMGFCGEKAYDKIKMMREGISSFRGYLIDMMSLLDDSQLKEGRKVDIY